MAQKNINGKYWLIFAEDDDICSQCEKPIKDGDKIFVDADGVYHKNKSMIEIGDVNIYHYDCIIEGNPKDSEPKREDYM